MNDHSSNKERNLVSIIVPIYNLDPYLKRCITSLRDQTHTNLQIILVDDGSTDHSAETCDRYAKKDKRIKVIRKHNGGVSSARNAGLQAAKGNYVCFVDADDYVAPQYVELLLQSVLETNADIAVCGLQRVTDTRSLSAEAAVPGVLNGDSALARMLISDDVSEIAIWNKIFKSDLLVGVTFPTDKIYSEDVDVIYRLYRRAVKVSYIGDILYNYFQRETSVTNKGFTRDGFNSTEVADAIVEDIKINKPGLLSAAYKFRLRFTFTLLGEICRSEAPDLGSLRVLTQWARKHIGRIVTDRYVPVGGKLRLLILILGARTYVGVSRVLNRPASGSRMVAGK